MQQPPAAAAHAPAPASSTPRRLAARRLGTLLAAAVLAACGGGDDDIEASSGLVIRNATVVDTRSGTLAQGMTLLVDGGRIQKITPYRVRATGTAQTVDATGQYVVPGYMDMHAHAMETADLTPSFFPLMVANGITGFREESTSAANQERAVRLNADSAAGRVAAPEAIFSGTEAHLNPALGTLEGANAALPSIDHLGAGMGLIMDCSTQAAAIRADALANGYKPPFPADYVPNPRAYDAALNAPFYQRILDTYSPALCTTLAQAFVRNNTWHTPTLIRLRTQDWGNDPLYRNAPELRYVSAQRLAGWNKLGDQFATLPASAVRTLQDYYALQLRVTKLLYDNGVKMMAGSDLGGVWLVAGFSLHQEFQELAKAGLTPLQVLQTTTLNAAEFLGRQASAGTVEEGRNADLVLLRANPLTSVDNLAGIAGVVLRGRYFPPAALDQMKSDVAAAYR